MKYKITTLILLIYISCTFGWGQHTHRGMTKAAIDAVFGVDSTEVNFTIKIKYDPDAYIASTVLMGFGGTSYSPLATLTGLIIDETYVDSKLTVDTTWVFPDKTDDKWKYKTTIPVYDMFIEAGQDPDGFDDPTALAGEGRLLLGHMYTPNGIGYADQMTKYFYDKAVNAYTKKNDKYLAFAYLGFATHYFADVFVPVHVESDYLDVNNLMYQINSHSDVEDWISTNWYAMFQTEAEKAAKYPMPVCDIPATVRSMAIETYQDAAPMMKAWGVGSSSPKDQKSFKQIVNKEIWRCVPRISGMYLKFQEDVNYKP
ncbi:zinc dependent phospholipase C family protein [candidate division KSB1 bacterium]|nr:zinc dependent phospholipase C family protein [candidate division KSB1 bacterium]